MRCVIKFHFKLWCPLFSRIWASDVHSAGGLEWGWWVAVADGYPCSNESGFVFGHCIMSHCIFVNVSPWTMHFQIYQVKNCFKYYSDVYSPCFHFHWPHPKYDTDTFSKYFCKYYFYSSIFFSLKWQCTQKWKFYWPHAAPNMYKTCKCNIMYNLLTYFISSTH